MMNTRDILNEYLYPDAYQNTRRKEFPYYDQVAVAAGTTEYFFFNTPVANQFQRNKQLPLAGSQVFFIEAISMYLQVPINTPALINALNEILQQSFLEISVDNRVQMKIPGADVMQYLITLNADATPEILTEQPRLTKRFLPLPVVLNSTSAFQFRFVTTAAAATAFDTIPLRLVLHGLQLDKLQPFHWDNLKNNKFQQVPVTYYDTVVIPSAAQQAFSFFGTPNKAPNLFSKTFPLSDINTMSIQNIEVLVNQPDTPIVANTIYNSRLSNVLKIDVDNINMYEGNLVDCLSVVAGFAGNMTDSGANTLAYNQFMDVRQSKTFRVPLEIPAQSEVNVSIEQPAASLGITGEITLMLRGVETRRVA